MALVLINCSIKEFREIKKIVLTFIKESLDIHNLEKQYLRIYLQGSNGETDMQNRLKDMGRGEERARCMERVTWKLILPYAK